MKNRLTRNQPISPSNSEKKTAQGEISVTGNFALKFHRESPHIFVAIFGENFTYINYELPTFCREKRKNSGNG